MKGLNLFPKESGRSPGVFSQAQRLQWEKEAGSSWVRDLIKRIKAFRVKDSLSPRVGEVISEDVQGSLEKP